MSDSDPFAGSDLPPASHEEAEAWKVAQLAATLLSGAMANFKAINISDAVTQSRQILAIAREQTKSR